MDHLKIDPGRYGLSPPGFMPIMIEDNGRESKKEPKIDFEFQEIGIELQKVYGKQIWALFYKPYIQFKDKQGRPWRSYITEHKIRKAHDIAQKRGIKSYVYLLGIIKKLEAIQVI